MTKIEINLTENELKEIKVLTKKDKRHQTHVRFQCIKLLNEKKTIEEIMEELRISHQAIYNWANLYKAGGVVEVSRLYKVRRKSILTPHSEDIRNYIENNIVLDINQVVSYITSTFGIALKYDAVHDFLKKNSIILAKNQKEFRLGKRRKRSRQISLKNCTA